jgi:hypothetical protein
MNVGDRYPYEQVALGDERDDALLGEAHRSHRGVVPFSAEITKEINENTPSERALDYYYNFITSKILRQQRYSDDYATTTIHYSGSDSISDSNTRTATTVFSTTADSSSISSSHCSCAPSWRALISSWGKTPFACSCARSAPTWAVHKGELATEKREQGPIEGRLEERSEEGRSLDTTRQEEGLVGTNEGPDEVNIIVDEGPNERPPPATSSSLWDYYHSQSWGLKLTLWRCTFGLSSSKVNCFRVSGDEHYEQHPAEDEQKRKSRSAKSVSVPAVSARSFIHNIQSFVVEYSHSFVEYIQSTTSAKIGVPASAQLPPRRTRAASRPNTSSSMDDKGRRPLEASLKTSSHPP